MPPKRRASAPDIIAKRYIRKRKIRKFKNSYLDRLLKANRVLLAKADTSPLKHLCFFSKVRDNEHLVLGEECLVFLRD